MVVSARSRRALRRAELLRLACGLQPKIRLDPPVDPLTDLVTGRHPSPSRGLSSPLRPASATRDPHQCVPSSAPREMVIMASPRADSVSTPRASAKGAKATTPKPTKKPAVGSPNPQTFAKFVNRHKHKPRSKAKRSYIVLCSGDEHESNEVVAHLVGESRVDTVRASFTESTDTEIDAVLSMSMGCSSCQYTR